MRERTLVAVLAFPFQEEAAVEGARRGAAAVTWTAFTPALALALCFPFLTIGRPLPAGSFETLLLLVRDGRMAPVAPIPEPAGTVMLEEPARGLPAAAASPARGADGGGIQAPGDRSCSSPFGRGRSTFAWH